MPDANLHSFNGPDHDNQRFELPDEVIDGSAYASAIKCSTGLHCSQIYAKEVIGGRDTCVDVNNNCHDLVLNIGALKPTGQFAISVKGNSDRVKITAELFAHGKSADVELGGWSDQSHATSDNNVLAITSMTGKPVRVRVLKATAPALVNGTGPYVYLFPSPKLGALHRLIVYGYETLRRWGFFRRYAN